MTRGRRRFFVASAVALALSSLGSLRAEAVQIRLQPGQQRHILLAAPRPLAFAMSLLDANGAPNASDCLVYICVEDPNGLLVLSDRIEVGRTIVFDLRPVQMLNVTFRASTNGTFGALFDALPAGTDPPQEFNLNGTSSDNTCVRGAAARGGFIRSECPPCYRYRIENPGMCTLRIQYQEMRRVGTGNQWTENGGIQTADLGPGGVVDIGPFRIRQIAISCEPIGPTDAAPCKFRATPTRLAEGDCP